eukprot:16016625-Heterocapsa_arctica.AAC.1
MSTSQTPNITIVVCNGLPMPIASASPDSTPTMPILIARPRPKPRRLLTRRAAQQVSDTVGGT